MLFSHFLNAAFALYVEERQRLNPFTPASEITDSVLPTDAPVERAPSRREVAAQNQNAIAQLKAMMSGVTGGPRV